MRTKNRIRHILQLFVLAAIMMMVPLPSHSVLPAVTEVYASEYYGYYFFDDYEEEEPEYKISDEAIWMNAGKTRKLKVSNASGNVKWSSSNKKVAKVSSKGVVTAKKAGKATITAKCPALGKSVKCKVRVFTQSSVKKKLLKLKKNKKYKEGKKWTNENNHYFWEATNTYAMGCYALVGIFSDHVFGKDAPVKTHTSFKKIKAGDHIRIGESHSVVVLEKKGNTLTIVEGNYNRSVHWGRKLTKKYLESQGFWVETRYW